jgi:hypothetical protein
VLSILMMAAVAGLLAWLVFGGPSRVQIEIGRVCLAALAVVGVRYLGSRHERRG